jgi:hypothetical protein
MAGMGFAGPKSGRQHGPRPNRNVGLHLLRHLLSAVRALGLLWRSILRSLLLLVLPAEHSLPQQSTYFSARQGRIVPVRSVPPIAGTKILSHSGLRGMSIPAGQIHGLPLISTVPRRS